MTSPVADEPLKILVADDEPAMVGVMGAILGAVGHRIVAAYDGREALRRFYEEAPDLVLLDLAMPGTDGADVCRAIRMTGGVVAGLGPVGANFGAGMTGGRAYLLDPAGRAAAALVVSSVAGTRLSAVLRDRGDGAERLAELLRLVEEHAAAGSELAERLALRGGPRPDDVWLVEPIATRTASPVPSAQVVREARPTPAATHDDASRPVPTLS